ncbi:MAG: aminodeoxychorismate/anthranilate synthase component II [Halobacteria archaeon]
MRVAVVDNYDSFSNNLEQYVGEFAEVEVERYVSPPDADGVVFSPGPGKPGEFPVMYEVLEDAVREGFPVLGVCLGHQAVAEYFGGTVSYSDEVVHGKTSEIDHNGSAVFAGIENPMTVGRYHSLVVDEVPDELEVTARGAGEVMAVEHRKHPIYGVQFHPESILTDSGKMVIENFVEIVEALSG